MLEGDSTQSLESSLTDARSNGMIWTQPDSPFGQLTSVAHQLESALDPSPGVTPQPTPALSSAQEMLPPLQSGGPVIPSNTSLIPPSTAATTSLISISYLVNLDPNSNEFAEILRKTLYSDDYRRFITSLKGDEAKDFINFLDNALNYINGDPELFHKCLRALRKICGLSLQLPSSHWIPEIQLIREGEHPFASGGFSDVWAGTFGQRKVAIKCLKTNLHEDSAKIMKALCKEVIVWKRLSHPNILPLLGVSTMYSRFCMVSEQMMSKTIMDYLRAHPRESRLALLSDVAAGLEYMHSFRIVHGDLKGQNILIDDLGHARLADFGLNSITIDNHSVNASSANNGGGTARWRDSYLLDPDEPQASRPNQESDIYSFAMVAIEVFTGKVPFPDMANTKVIIVTSQGRRPKRPEDAKYLGLSDSVWDMIKRCWDEKPGQRPPTPEVVVFFKQADAAFIHVPAPGVPASSEAGYTVALTQDSTMPPLVAPFPDQLMPVQALLPELPSITSGTEGITDASQDTTMPSLVTPLDHLAPHTANIAPFGHPLTTTESATIVAKVGPPSLNQAATAKSLYELNTISQPESYSASKTEATPLSSLSQIASPGPGTNSPALPTVDSPPKSIQAPRLSPTRLSDGTSQNELVVPHPHPTAPSRDPPHVHVPDGLLSTSNQQANGVHLPSDPKAARSDGSRSKEKDTVTGCRCLIQ